MKLENFKKLIAGKAMIFPWTKEALPIEIIPIFLDWLYSSGFEIIRKKKENK